MVAVAAGTPAPGMMGGRTEAFGPDGVARPDASTSDLVRTHFLPFAPGYIFAVSRDCFFAAGGFEFATMTYSLRSCMSDARGQPVAMMRALAGDP